MLNSRKIELGNLDLFGQVPITKLELKRKLKSNRTLGIDDAIFEVIRNKIETSNNLEPFQSRPWNYHNIREFQKKTLTINENGLSNYLKLCQDQACYIKMMLDITSRIEFDVSYNESHRRSLLDCQIADDLRRSAIEIISRLTSSTITYDKLIAKKLKKEYSPQIKKLFVHDVKILYKAKSLVPMQNIPWELATPAAKNLAIEMGIYSEPKIPYYVAIAQQQKSC